MGIRGEKVNLVLREEVFGESFCIASEAARKRRRRDLYQAAEMDPFIKSFGGFLDDGITLRVSKDGLDSGDQKLMKNLGHLLRNGEVGKLHEQVIFLIDGVFVRILECVVDVLK